jgi:hypothetical protein
MLGTAQLNEFSSRKEPMMLRKTLVALIVTGFVSSAGIEVGTNSVAAAVPAGYSPMTTTANANIQPVAWVYVKGKHGARYKHKRGGYGYYYGGWWYARPWWTIGVGPVAVYTPGLYGPRYKYKRAGYGYYHKGYWYRKKWWK